MNTNQKHQFIDHNDDLARLINDRANHLYQQLLTLDISDTAIDDYGKNYFYRHHGSKRLFFSIQSSADIIYKSVKKINKPLAETSFIDYGAGLGTLFLLAGMAGFKKVYFNDYFPEWAGYAKIIAAKLGITIDDYISGDIDDVINYSKANNVRIDIIASRNVVEHIYDLRGFYTKIYNSGIAALCYGTTTANYHNLAMRLKHYWHHYSLEKRLYKKQREDYLKELVPAIKSEDLQKLIKITRGRAFEDFTKAVDLYFANQSIPPVEFLRTNTCDCKTGVWAENLLTRREHIDIMSRPGFKTVYTAGFWDTHYKYGMMNLIARLLNSIIKVTGKKGYWFAPFVNTIAIKN